MVIAVVEIYKVYVVLFTEHGGVKKLTKEVLK